MVMLLDDFPADEIELLAAPLVANEEVTGSLHAKPERARASHRPVIPVAAQTRK